MMTPFADLAAAAGAGPQLTAYLAARNLHRTATLALIATALPEFEDRVVRPFLEGVEIAGTHYQAPEAEHSVVQAIMHHMWAEARKQWATHIEVPAPAAVPVRAAAPPGAVVPALPGDRPPKTFPEWGPLVKRYNEVTVAGEPRDFPTNLLLGAEEVLARMYFEHTKSKEYTAVGDPAAAHLHGGHGGEPAGGSAPQGEGPGDPDRRRRLGSRPRGPVEPEGDTRRD